MTSKGLREMFEGGFTDTYGDKFPLMSMGGRAKPSSVRRRGARTPIGVSGNLLLVVSEFPIGSNFFRCRRSENYFWRHEIDHFFRGTIAKVSLDEEKIIFFIHHRSPYETLAKYIFSPSGLRALHGTKCPLLTALFSLSSLFLLRLLFSQKGL